MIKEETVLNIISNEGPLSRCLKGYECREQQQKMLLQVLNAYNKDKIALIEAGTGTGKSIAYLLPAILWAVKFKQRTVISTNTINLQEQLIEKDIPLLTKALGVNINAVLAKGIGNYVCKRKLFEIRSEFNLFSPAEKAELDKIDAWNQNAKEGSRSSLPIVPSGKVWELVGADHDTCNHRKCDFYKDCFYQKDRKKAQEAQIIVANHHLLCSDLLKKDEQGDSEEAGILPPYQRVILDEAHNLENVATDFFADHINQLELYKTLHRLSSDKMGEALGKLVLLRQIIEKCLNKNLSEEAALILKNLSVDLPGLRWDLWHQAEAAFEAIAKFAWTLRDKSKNAQEDLKSNEIKLRLRDYHLGHPDWQSNVLPKAKKFSDTLSRYIISILGLHKAVKELKNDRLSEMTKGVLSDILALTEKLSGYNTVLQNCFPDKISPDKVRWIEVKEQQKGRSISLIDADLDVSKALVKYLFNKFDTIVLCSATLTANQEFKFIRHRLGLVPELLTEINVTENIFDSPFDYHKQAIFAVPTDIPLPTEPAFVKAAAEHIWQAIQASRGNAFVLFTSYSMLDECYSILFERLQQNRYCPLKQGEAHRTALLNKFKSVNRSVLFGTESFWEGVDVVGEALRCVIIVKLPFKVPSEPIIEARSEAILAKGGDPFFEYSLPNAIVKFKQGFGRLIRNKSDRGCVVCLDTRIIKKGYGQFFLQSLPACHQVFDISDKVYAAMQDFYRNGLKNGQKWTSVD